MLVFRVATRLGQNPLCFHAASVSVLNQQKKLTLTPIVVQQNRNLSFINLGSVLNEFRAFSEGFSGTIWSKNVIEFFMETCDLSFTSSLIVTGLIVRIAMLPFYYLAESNNAKRLHAQNIIAARATEKIARRYGMKTSEFTVGDVTVIGLVTKKQKENERLMQEHFHLVNQSIHSYNKLHGLNIRHTLYTLSIPAIPYVSLFFAARDLMFGGIPLTLGGWMWISNLSQPDPFFVLPFLVSSLFLSNHLLRHRFNKIDNLGLSSPVVIQRMMQLGYGFFYMFIFAAIANGPAALQLYWLTVGLHGLLQNLLLRTPAVKQRLKIPWLPSDRNFREWKDYLFFWKLHSNLPKNKPNS
uniref:Uncharacterized protein n=1 Tax=Acrobeloides nanus TaxID=290746 RepID=A0A914CLU9_9BILA